MLGYARNYDFSTLPFTGRADPTCMVFTIREGKCIFTLLRH
jgi:hypothetical protein